MGCTCLKVNLACESPFLKGYFPALTTFLLGCLLLSSYICVCAYIVHTNTLLNMTCQYFSLKKKLCHLAILFTNKYFECWKKSLFQFFHLRNKRTFKFIQVFSTLFFLIFYILIHSLYLFYYPFWRVFM